MSILTFVSLNPQRVVDHVNKRFNEVSSLTDELIELHAEQMMKEKTSGMFKKSVYKNKEDAVQAALQLEPIQNIKTLYSGEIELLKSIKTEAQELVEQGVSEFQVPTATLKFLGPDFKNEEPTPPAQIRLEQIIPSQSDEPELDLLDQALEESKKAETREEQ